MRMYDMMPILRLARGLDDLEFNEVVTSIAKSKPIPPEDFIDYTPKIATTKGKIANFTAQLKQLKAIPVTKTIQETYYDKKKIETSTLSCGKWIDNFDRNNQSFTCGPGTGQTHEICLKEYIDNAGKLRCHQNAWKKLEKAEICTQWSTAEELLQNGELKCKDTVQDWPKYACAEEDQLVTKDGKRGCKNKIVFVPRTHCKKYYTDKKGQLHCKNANITYGEPHEVFKCEKTDKVLVSGSSEAYEACTDEEEAMTDDEVSDMLMDIGMDFSAFRARRLSVEHIDRHLSRFAEEDRQLLEVCF
eukprot:TRINITY_DN20421_c0_g1_i2.p1 TRINITY_DN20421_c0_g1~~TRINITY_DN20421_c0_g1_i2.p1  ORF type:complete len:302 (-),score=39.92 TRINITY_DN20421_c0_g1_i2:48-953(-)